MNDTSVVPAPDAGGRLDAVTARELLSITRTMVTAAHADDWGTVTRHDRTRRELLAAAPTNPAEELPVALIEALAAADQALLERARRVRDLAGEDTHRARVERDARDTYSRVMSGDGYRET